MRLDGNSFLILEGDADYVQGLKNSIEQAGGNCAGFVSLEEAKAELLTSDWDVVISSHYLPDGIIHELIDWCKNQLQILPTFAMLVCPVNNGNVVLHRQLVAEVFHKGQDHLEIVQALSLIIFDYKRFNKFVLDCLEPQGFNLELYARKTKTFPHAIEINADSIYLTVNHKFDQGTLGLLRMTIFEQADFESFTVIGTFVGQYLDGQLFNIDAGYKDIWSRLLIKLEGKQQRINNFLQKASGK